MEQSTQLIFLVLAALIGIFSALLILRRQRVEEEAASRESPFGVSTEGEKRCPSCGMGNLWTDRNCISCKARLPG
jgi:hypothetical protein